MTGADILIAAPFIGVGAWLAWRHPNAAVVYAAGFALACLGLALTVTTLTHQELWP